MTLEAIPTRARLSRVVLSLAGKFNYPLRYILLVVDTDEQSCARADARIYTMNGMETRRWARVTKKGRGLDGWRSCFSRNLPRQPTTFTLLVVATPAATRLARHSSPAASNHRLCNYPAPPFYRVYGVFLNASSTDAFLVSAFFLY